MEEKTKNILKLVVVAIIVIIGLITVFGKDKMSNHSDGKCDVCGSEYLWYDTSSAELCYTCYQKAIEWSEKHK